jgi:hypothetical protein
MPGLRLLLRIAPWMVGAVAVGVWLRRRAAERKALPAGVGVRELAAGEAAGAPAGAANYALNGEPAGSAPAAPQTGAEPGGRVESGGRPEPAPRFQREPIDIVTVVDDLLQSGH